jgi:glucokinase
MERTSFMHYYAGIDLGGTKIAAGIVDVESGAVAFRRVIPTPTSGDPEEVLRAMSTLVLDLIAESGLPVEGIGVGVPAVVDYDTGSTLLVPNISGDWYQRPVVSTIAAQTGLPVAILNDARSFTLAEAVFGAGKGAETCVCFTLGTGIGGGAAINGRLHMGLKGAAAEFGHQIVEPHGPRCGCGNQGCLEAKASGAAIATKAAQVAGEHPDSALAQISADKLTPAAIRDAAAAGDAYAAELLYEAGFYLGIGLANVVTFFGPDRVVLGGGLTALGDWLLVPARESLRSHCHTIDLDEVQIVQAALGLDAGMVGAALWASQRSTASQKHTAYQKSTAFQNVSEKEQTVS